MIKLSKNKKILGTIWMLGFILNITITAICIRELSFKYSSFEIQNFRNIFSIIIILIFFKAKNNVHLTTFQLKNNFIRNIFHFIGQSAWTWGLTVLPLAVVFSLEFTMPIWAAIIAIIIFKEKITLNKILFLILGLLGTWIILLPDTKYIGIYNIIVLFSAITYAIAHNFTKKLTGTDSIISILFYMAIIQLPFSLIGSFIVDDLHYKIAKEMPLIILLTITSLLAHYCLSSALKNSEASVVLPIDYIRLPLIIFIGWYYYDEIISSNVFIGSVFIIFGVIVFLNKDFKNK
ncbi:MAG TPA: DMT family transporter [Alphaproteobacteria bacterium]|jgi:drug/metabolite transporter (DMT)-like permease|nr:DMT family transporter [Alphaproteobacteria bacterium]